jgi:alkylhydroperoxidase family enzyme
MDPQPRIAPAVWPAQGPLAATMAKLLPPGMEPPKLFLTVARNEPLFRFLVDSGWIGATGLFDRRTLPKAVRECVILRTCVATRNDYEFNLHVQTISERMGLSREQIDDLRNPTCDAALWGEDFLALVPLIDALVARDVDDATFAAARRHFDDATLIEITQLAGLYVQVAMQVALSRPAFDAYRWSEPVRTDPRTPGLVARS